MDMHMYMNVLDLITMDNWKDDWKDDWKDAEHSQDFQSSFALIAPPRSRVSSRFRYLGALRVVHVVT